MRQRFAVTMGDAAGIGAEIIVKAMAHPEIRNSCIPVVIGDRVPIEDAISFCGSDLRIREIERPEDAEGAEGVLELIHMGLLEAGDWTYGQVGQASGEASFQYIVKAIEYAMENRVQGVITGPINKEAINLAGHHYSGHTEIFAEYTNTKEYGMLLTSPKLRVIHVTTHVSMADACRIIGEDRERVAASIRLAFQAMNLLGIENPRIGVAGLNAHCSENGLFGDEEERSIIPAIEQCRKEGITAEGPIPPDTVFVKAMGGQFDVVVAMYHDQGHIPLKLSGFVLDEKTQQYTVMTGVNSTIGLPIIRTSVDHGTAYGKAGKGRANEESMCDAIAMAVQMASVKFA